MIWVAVVAAACAVWFWLAGPPLQRLREPSEWAMRLHRTVRSPRGTLPHDSMTALPVTEPRAGRFTDVLRRRLVRAPMPDVAWVCELLALCLDAGAPPRLALAQVAAVATGSTQTALNGVLHQIELGVDEADAWRSLAAMPRFAAVARDVARSLRRGSALAQHLRRHARESRNQAHSQALAHARTSGVRSVIPLVVCFLPAFVLVGVVPVLGGSVFALLG